MVIVTVPVARGMEVQELMSQMNSDMRKDDGFFHMSRGIGRMRDCALASEGLERAPRMTIHPTEGNKLTSF
jgi:hypothetical protein